MNKGVYGGRWPVSESRQKSPENSPARPVRVGIEVKAEVFRVIRANIDKPNSRIVDLIFEHLPDIPREQIVQALKELSE